VFDCQFSWPDHRWIQPNFKHIASVLQFRGNPEDPRDDPVAPPGTTALVDDKPVRPGERAGNASRPFQVVQRAAGAARNQVLVWWAGQLVQELPWDRPKGRPAYSPLTAALLAALERTPDGTYEDWIAAAAGRMHGSRRLGLGTLVVQGPINRPLFAAGRDDSLLELLLSDHYRRRFNLDLAADTIASAGPLLDQPLDRLCHAAVLFHRAGLFWAEPSDGPTDRTEAELDNARQLLLDLTADAAKLVEEKLIDQYVALVARAFDADRARDVLVQLLQSEGVRVMTAEFEAQLINCTRAAMAQDAKAKVEASITAVKNAELPDDVRKRVKVQLRQLLAGYDGPLDLRPVVPPVPFGSEGPGGMR
jgi:hypothetical protein